jgi:[citrate (pro-3S)-lyase] ligase
VRAAIKSINRAENIAAIVINGNPFTLGHQYLIEKASKENDLVYIFVVEAEKSTFSFVDRFEMIRQGTRHLPNVKLVKGGEYIVSSATFPNYFLKNESPDAITQKQAELDIEIFTQHIAPLLGITKRYVGTENYCATTALYNKAMKAILPVKGIAFCEVQRLETDNQSGEFISASKVRAAIKSKELQLLQDLLPETTIAYLRETLELGEIQQQLQVVNTRH